MTREERRAEERAEAVAEGRAEREDKAEEEPVREREPAAEGGDAKALVERVEVEGRLARPKEVCVEVEEGRVGLLSREAAAVEEETRAVVRRRGVAGRLGTTVAEEVEETVEPTSPPPQSPAPLSPALPCPGTRFIPPSSPAISLILLRSAAPPLCTRFPIAAPDD